MQRFLFALLVAAILIPPPALAADDSPGVVYRVERVWSPENELISEDVVGVPWIDGPNGEKFFFRNSTIGPDGKTYVLSDGAGDCSPNDGEKHNYTTVSEIREAAIQHVRWQNAVERLRKNGAPEGYIQYVIDGHTGRLPVTPPVKTDPTLAETVDKLTDPDEPIDITVVLAEQPPLDLPRVDLDVETGLPGFTMDAYIQRLQAIRDRMSAMAELQAALAGYIEDKGGVVTDQYWAINALRATVPAHLVSSIAERANVQLVHDSPKPVPFDVTLPAVRKSTQIEYFRRERCLGPACYSFEGQRDSGRSQADDIYVAVMDLQAFNDDHSAFKDALTGTRIRNRYNCADLPYSCEEGELDPNATGNHGTTVAGIVAADLMDGQDIYYTGETGRLLRSGMAAEVELCLINTGDHKTHAVEAAIEENVDILVSSVGALAGRTCGGVYYGPEICPSESQARGTDELSQAVNAAFSDGIFHVNAAGNQGIVCGCDEQVASPAGAAAAFAVGAYEATSENPVTAFHTSGLIFDRSSTGPTPDGRKKPDIAAPTLITNTLSETGHWGPSGYDPNATSNGTSWAAPVVGGAAAIFKDWYIFTFGQAAANYPGKIFVNLLNFGDRKNLTTSASDYFSNSYGAGRLRLRLPRNEGMDTPWRWHTYMTTLADGQSHMVWMGPINDEQGEIPTEVNFLKLALWWYEPNTADGQPKPAISVDLWDETYPPTVEAHFSLSDQKIHFIRDDYETTFDQFVGGQAYAFVINADYIPSGTRTIYWTFFWEDLARDDADGPCTMCGIDNPLFLFYR